MKTENVSLYLLGMALVHACDNAIKKGNEAALQTLKDERRHKDNKDTCPAYDDYEATVAKALNEFIPWARDWCFANSFAADILGQYDEGLINKDEFLRGVAMKLFARARVESPCRVEKKKE